MKNIEGKRKQNISSFFDDNQPQSILLQAAWFGLFFGFAEVGYNLFFKLIRHRVIFQSQHFVWMIPIALVGLFLIVGLILMLFSLRWHRLGSLAVSVPVFVFIGIMAMYYVKPKINLWAILLLTAGISIQLGRLASSRGQLFNKIVKKTLPLLLILLMIIVFVMRIFHP